MEACFKNLSYKKIKAFTLAEVLITLGIIGAVAGLTIPTLMNQIQDKQFKEAAKTAFSKASQAVQQMKLDEGGSLTAYYGTSDNKFKNAFVSYFKVAKDCGNWAGCVPYSTSSTVYSNLKGEPANTWMFNEGQFVTTDGMFWGVNTFLPDYIPIMVDINGYGKGPNIYGRDTFFFVLINDKLLPMGALSTAYYRTDSYYCSRTISDGTGGCGCMEYVMEGKDY